MTTHHHPNGALPTAVQTVRDPDAQDRAGALLDELDSLIVELDHAIAEHTAARLVIADAETELSVIEAGLLLGIAESNAERRKAALTLALQHDPGYQEFARAVRQARATLFSAERRMAVAKERTRLVRAALALLAERADN